MKSGSIDMSQKKLPGQQISRITIFAACLLWLLVIVIIAVTIIWLSRKTGLGWALLIICLGIVLLMVVFKIIDKTIQNITASALRHLNNISDMPARVEILKSDLDNVSLQYEPDRWASLAIELADSLAQNPIGNVSENLEQAIFIYQKILEIYTRQASPEKWAGAYHDMGNIFVMRIHGDKAENLEQAIYYYKQALEIFTFSGYPEKWASTQNGLGNAYQHRVHGNRDENIKQAIYHRRQSLDVFSEQDYPEQWADTQHNLATSYYIYERGSGNKSENIEKAIEHCQQALKVTTRQSSPENWAMTLNALALAYSDRVYSKQALEIFTRQSYPTYWALTQNNLGVAYASGFDGKKTNAVKQAIFHYLQALEIYNYQDHPEDCRRVSRGLGILAFDNQLFELAIQAFQQTMNAHLVMQETALDSVGKSNVIEEIRTIPAKMAFAYIQLGQPMQAIEILEEGRAQLLRDALENKRQNLQKLPILGFGKLYERFTFAMQEDSRLQSIPAQNRASDWLENLERVRAETQDIAKTIREQAGAKDHQYRFFQRSFPFDEIKKQAQDAPLIYVVVTEHGGIALIVFPQGKPQIVELPTLTENSLRENIWILTDDEAQVMDQHLQQGFVSSEDINVASKSYSSMYALWRITVNSLDMPQDTKSEVFEHWMATLNKTLGWLGEAVMSPLLQALNGVSRAVLIPSGLLGLFPLHSAIVSYKIDNLDLQSVCPQYAFDFCTFTYAPSAQALYHARFGAERPTTNLLAVDNPDGSLTFTEAEVQSVIKHFPQSTHLLHEQATKDAVLRTISSANVLHFSTHGTAGWNEANDSRLILGDSDLTMPELFQLHLENARLAVLSACETGIPGTKLPDEVQSLPSAFMQAGVPGVIGSLWSVSDMSTAILMARFYDLWRVEGFPAPDALRYAQIWLRDSTALELKSTFEMVMKASGAGMSTTSADAFFKRVVLEEPDACPFFHPFYWAAFTYTGI
jgi:hypothetical protein